MNARQNVILAMLFISLLAISAWFQFGLLASREHNLSIEQKDAPDYYIENFVATGVDRHGRKYRIIAESMAHYPLAERASLQRPHIIQYQPPSAPRHIYADSGWLRNGDTEVLLSGNVKVVESQSGDLDGVVATSNQMLIRLKRDNN